MGNIRERTTENDCTTDSAVHLLATWYECYWIVFIKFWFLCWNNSYKLMKSPFIDGGQQVYFSKDYSL